MQIQWKPEGIGITHQVGDKFQPKAFTRVQPDAVCYEHKNSTFEQAVLQNNIINFVVRVQHIKCRKRTQNSRAVAASTCCEPV